MRFLFTFLLAVIGLNSLFAQPDKSVEQKKANEFFIRQIRTAHPEPERNIKVNEMLVPLQAEGEGFSDFLNIEMTVNETGTFRMQNESSIAVNPANPDNLIGSAVDYRDTSATWVYVSHDGGKSWVNLKLGRPHEGWSASNDPSVAYDLDGTAYLVIGSFGKRGSGLQGQAVENGVFLLRSTDEGYTWTNHIPVIEHTGEQTIDSTFEDKYYIWCDNSKTSPYKGHLYIPWKRVWAKDSATQIVISKSTDKGNTWSKPVAVSPRLPGTSEDTTYGQSFPLAVTGPNGEVYLVWNNGIEHAIGFSRSTDGGTTWTASKLINHYDIFGTSKEIDDGIWRHVLKGKVRAEAYPSLAVDNTDGARSGWLYLTWAADRVPNVYFSRSTDMGETWSEPVVVHSDTTNDQFWQWIALDKTNGDIAVLYLDSRDDPDNILTAAYVSYSSDGGTTWTDRRAADISSDLRKNPFKNNIFAGDYNGCAFHNGIVYPSWVDMRNAVSNIYDSDVYTAFVDVNKPASVENFDAITIPEQQDAVKIQWDMAEKKVFGQPLDTNDIKYILKRGDDVIAVLPAGVTNYTDTGLNKFELYHYSIAVKTPSDTSAFVQDSAWAGGSIEPGIPVLVDNARDNSQLDLYYKIPDKRLDGVTPFVNPKQIKMFRDYALAKKQDLNPEDTGKVVDLIDNVPGNGYYQYYAIVEDSYSNVSPPSESKYIYAGEKLSNYADDFNEAELRKYLNESGWGLSSDFAVTGNSLTDSPDGNYEPLTNTMLTVFPYEGASDKITLSFQHAAFVEKGDSAIVEFSLDSMRTWQKLYSFDKTMYPSWKDNIKDKYDWKYEQFNLSKLKAPVYFRFRLKTNAIRQNDGWYIDDLSITSETGIEENNERANFVLYPNPAKGFVNISVGGFKANAVESLNIYDNLGNKYNLDYSLRDNYYHINTNELATGVYFIGIKLKNGDFILKKFIKLSD